MGVQAATAVTDGETERIYGIIRITSARFLIVVTYKGRNALASLSSFAECTSLRQRASTGLSKRAGGFNIRCQQVVVARKYRLKAGEPRIETRRCLDCRQG